MKALLTPLATLLLLSACTGERAKEATSTVIGKAVELGKGTASGIAEGVEEGRKGAPSADGAIVVMKWEELGTNGDITVLGKKGEGTSTVVELALENKGDAPLRLAGVEILGFDADGFTLNPTSPAIDQTIPPKAKAKATVSFAAEPAKVAKIRVWTHDLTVP
jgi:hypothetical protein